MLEASNSIAFLQPGSQDVSCEIVMSAEFGPKDGFAVVPKGVDAVQEARLVWWSCWFGEEPSQKHGSDLALQSAELDHAASGSSCNDLRSLHRRALEDRWMAWLVMCWDSLRRGLRLC